MPQRTEEQDHHAAGAVCAVGAFLFWGFAPLFWKLLREVPARELLAHRLVWSIPCLALLLGLGRKWPALRAAFGDARVRRVLFFSTALIGVNWWAFVYAINTDRVLQASLGYYINPLMNVLLGTFLLKERLRRLQWAAVALAAAGVALMTHAVGALPWIALLLAVTFAFYGLARKTVKAEPTVGLAFEVSLLAPLGLVYLLWLESGGFAALTHGSSGRDLLLVAAGPVTVAPLVLFTIGARRLRLSTLGFLQYLTPTAQFLIAVLLYREPFGAPQSVAFGLIWVALAVYSYDAHRARGAER